MIGKATGKHSDNVEEEYRNQYYAALDSAVTCIKERFEQKDHEMYATLEQRYLVSHLRKSYRR